MSASTPDPAERARNVAAEFNLGEHLSHELNFSFLVIHEKFQKEMVKLYEFFKIVKTLRQREFFRANEVTLQGAAEEFDVWLEIAGRDLTALEAVPSFTEHECRMLDTGGGHHCSAELRKRGEEYVRVFRSIESRTVVTSALQTCKRLLPYRTYLENRQQLSYVFLLQMADGLFQPLPFVPTFNVVPFIVDDVDHPTTKYLMSAMRMLLLATYGFYEIYKQPDADPEMIRQRFLKALDDIEHSPDFAGCKDGIRLIRNSINTYVEGYSTYASPEGGAMGGLMSFMQDIATKKLQKKDMRARSQILKIIRTATQKWNSIPKSKRNADMSKMVGNINSATDALMSELNNLDDEDTPEVPPAEAPQPEPEAAPHVDLLAPENADALAALSEDAPKKKKKTPRKK